MSWLANITIEDVWLIFIMVQLSYDGTSKLAPQIVVVFPDTTVDGVLKDFTRSHVPKTGVLIDKKNRVDSASLQP